jgi:hypothetical protein
LTGLIVFMGGAIAIATGCYVNDDDKPCPPTVTLNGSTCHLTDSNDVYPLPKAAPTGTDGIEANTTPSCAYDCPAGGQSILAGGHVSGTACTSGGGGGTGGTGGGGGTGTGDN